MRVGVNALGQIRGGTLEHLRQLLDRWAQSIVGNEHSLVLFSSRGTLQRLGKLPGGIQIVPVPLGDLGVVFRIFAEQLVLPLLAWRHHIDVLFSPASTMPALSTTPSVVVLQNAAPFLPAHELKKFEFPVRLRMIVLRWFIYLSVRRATAIVFLSETFRRLISPAIRKPRPADTVLYHARPQLNPNGLGEVQTLSRTLGITRPYLLCVSHIYPYKNLTELVTAFGLLGSDSVQLVLVGQAISQDKYLAEVNACVQNASRFSGQVLLTSGLPHDQVQILLKGCLAFVFPSTCENCPIGLIEALSHHVPIACSEIGVMPEIAGKAALLFNPYETEEISRVLRTLISQSEVRANLVAESERELLRFGTAAQVADATWQVLSHVAESAR
jgi:glycosyltransferase involved in cell wall biosynthesis